MNDPFLYALTWIRVRVDDRLAADDGGDGNLGWIIRTLAGATIAVGLALALTAATDGFKNGLPTFGG